MREINFMKRNGTPMQHIERKLNEVLFGPYYQAGKELYLTEKKETVLLSS